MYAGDETYGDDVTSGIVRAGVQRARDERASWPRPNEPAPDLEALEDMSNEGEMEATDGCGGIEDDGICEHGHPSWMLELGMI